MAVFPIQNGSSNNYEGRSKEASCKASNEASSKHMLRKEGGSFLQLQGSNEASSSSCQLWAFFFVELQSTPLRLHTKFELGGGADILCRGCIRGVNLIINNNFQNCCGCTTTTTVKVASPMPLCGTTLGRTMQ
jgi:hypothetical protein